MRTRGELRGRVAPRTGRGASTLVRGDRDRLEPGRVDRLAGDLVDAVGARSSIRSIAASISAQLGLEVVEDAEVLLALEGVGRAVGGVLVVVAQLRVVALDLAVELAVQLADQTADSLSSPLRAASVPLRDPCVQGSHHILSGRGSHESSGEHRHEPAASTTRMEPLSLRRGGARGARRGRRAGGRAGRDGRAGRRARGAAARRAARSARARRPRSRRAPDPGRGRRPRRTAAPSSVASAEHAAQPLLDRVARASAASAGSSSGSSSTSTERLRVGIVGSHSTTREPSRADGGERVAAVVEAARLDDPRDRADIRTRVSPPPTSDPRSISTTPNSGPSAAARQSSTSAR